MSTFESRREAARLFVRRRLPGLSKMAASSLLCVAVLGGALRASQAAEQPTEWKGLRTVWYANWGAFLAFPDDNLRQEMPADDITALVAGVAQGSAAEAANLARGDWLVRTADKPAEVGQIDSFVIDRDGNRYSITITTRTHDFSTAVLARAGAPKGAPRTLVVAPDGRADYRTITRALSVAEPGDTVSVRDGLYREQLIVPHDVTLEAAEQSAVCMEAPAPMRLLGVEQCVIRGLSVRGLEKAGAIYVQGAKHVRFEDLTVSRDMEGALVQLEHSGDVKLARCSLLGMPNADGVRAVGSDAALVDSSIVQCLNGILARDNSQIQASGNVFEGNLHGIRALDSRLTAENNAVTGIDANGGGLVAVNSEVTIQGNTVRRQEAGLFAVNARGTVKDCTFAQCKTGMLLNSPGLEVAGNRVSTNKITGILLADGKNSGDSSSRTVVKNNTITFNGASGIAVYKHAANISGNVVEGNNIGILLVEGPADVVHNTVVLQRFAGFVADPQAQGSISNNIVALGSVGMQIDARSHCRCESNVVYGHFGSRRFPPVDVNYVRMDRLPLADGDLLRVSVFPAMDLPGKGDMQVDPKFVKIGSDYHLAADSPLIAAKGSDGKIIGALPAVE